MDEGAKKQILVALALGLVMMACAVTGGAEDGSATTPTMTPNLTLTAWFMPAVTSKTTEAPTQAPTSVPPTEAAAPTTTGEDSGGMENEPEEESGTAAAPTLVTAPQVDPVVLYAGDSTEDDETAPKLVAEYLDDPPAVDGDLSDWQGTYYALDHVVFGHEFFANVYDLSGAFKIGWDMEYLYLGVIVHDTKFVQTAQGPQLYLGDSLEMLVDAAWDTDLTDNELSSDDYQIGFSPGNLIDVAKPETYLWAPNERAGSLTSAKVQGRLTTDGYMMEIAFPWEEMNISPNDGMILGFLLSISDNDSVSQNKQHSVVSFSPVRKLHDPTSWSKLFLVNP